MDHELLNNHKDYNLQESLSLYRALKKAQSIYVNLYNIDITSVVSTSTLSLKIFRSKFQ